MKKIEMLNVLAKLENKYCDLVWWARSSPKHDHIEGVLESRKRVEENYPEETNSLLNDENPDWIHGFNSGMLAGIRYSLDLNIHGKEDADEFFPSLDT